METVSSDNTEADPDKRRSIVDLERRKSVGPERRKSVDPARHKSVDSKRHDAVDQENHKSVHPELRHSVDPERHKSAVPDEHKNEKPKSVGSDNLTLRNPECRIEYDIPDTPHRPFILMEELLEKLKLAKYESGFRQQQFKPISRHYFALATNPGEQFYYFVSLAAGLLKRCGRKMDEPRESDDPNALVAVILDSLRHLKFKPEFAPSKLKTGCGEQCIWVLDCLVSYIIQIEQLVYCKPCYLQNQSDDDQYVEIIDDTCDELEEDIDERKFSHCMADDIEEEDEDNLEFVYRTHSDAGSCDKMLEAIGQVSLRGIVDGRPAAVMESNTDSTEWHLEVEQVLPLLKFTEQSEKKDWRDHLQLIHHFSDTIESSMIDVRVQMNRLQDDITRTMDKINTREHYLNQHLQSTLAEHRDRQHALSTIKRTYRQASIGVGDKSSCLVELSERLEHVKQEMEERGTIMTDGVPLMKIKQAITRTRQEMSQMDVRIGLLQHMQLRLTFNSKIRMFDSDIPGC